MKNTKLKLSLAFLFLALLFIAGCGSSDENNKQTYTKQICSNQEAWNNRGSYPDFKCNVYLSEQGNIRECSATKVELGDNWEVIKTPLNTTCLEVTYES